MSKFDPEAISELIVITEDQTDVLEIIDLTPSEIKYELPLQNLQNSLLNLKDLQKIEYLKQENKIILEKPRIPKPPIIEIFCDPEVCPTAPQHPNQAKNPNRKLPWKPLPPSSNHFTPGEYNLNRLTAKEIQEDRYNRIIQNCGEHSKAKIIANNENTALDQLVIQLRLSIKHLPVLIWRNVVVPFKATFSYVKNIISDLFCINGQGGMFVFYAVNKEKVFLNSPKRNEEEKKADEDLINCEAVMNMISFEYSEIYFISSGEDNWYISIKVQKILEKDENETYPICLGGRYQAPPINVLFHKFFKVLKVLEDPRHRDFEKYQQKYKEWKTQKFSKFEADFPSLNVYNGRVRLRINDIATLNT